MTTLEETSPNVKPEIVFVYELIEQIGLGTLRVPRFQRPFVWRRDQMRDLLDSIWRRYPIGSLLLWDTDRRMSSFDAIGPLKVPDQPETEVSFVLDGHQRLSTLFGVLNNWEAADSQNRRQDDEDPNRWKIWYDAITGSFVHIDEERQKPEPHHFPMWKLLDTFAFLEEAGRVKEEGGEKAQEHISKFQQLSEIIRAYKLPVIRIRSTDLRQAVEIFSRLNSKGQQMTADQIVSALAYEETESGEPAFNLAAHIDDLQEDLQGWGFGEIDRATILRALLAALGEDIYRTDWTRIFQEKQNLRKRLPPVVKDTRRSLRQTIDFLQNLGIHNSRLLPYSMQIVVLSAFFKECEHPSQQQKTLLERWFWVTSFTGWFASGNPSRSRRLIEELRTEIAPNEEAVDLREMRLDTPAQPFPQSFDSRSARVRTFLLVLLSLEPRRLDGQLLKRPWELIERHGPPAVSQIISYWPGDKTNWSALRSSPANRILNLPEEVDDSHFKLRRGQAKTWLKELAERDLASGTLREVLESHGIPEDAFEELCRGNDHEFLEKRLDFLIDLDIKFMKERGVTVPAERTPAPSPVDSDDG